MVASSFLIGITIDSNGDAFSLIGATVRAQARPGKGKANRQHSRQCFTPPPRSIHTLVFQRVRRASQSRMRSSRVMP